MCKLDDPVNFFTVIRLAPLSTCHPMGIGIRGLGYSSIIHPCIAKPISFPATPHPRNSHGLRSYFCNGNGAWPPLKVARAA